MAKDIPPAPATPAGGTPYPEVDILPDTPDTPDTPDLPPAVSIWRETTLGGDVSYALMEQLPFTPIRFCLRRGYATEADARAAAWDELERHQSVRRIAQQRHEMNRRGTANE